MASTISELEVKLTFDDKDFRMGVKGSTAALKRFKAALGQSDTQAKKHEKSITSLGASFRHTVVTLGLLREAMRTAWQFTGGLVNGIVKVNAEFERLNVLLQGMSTGVTEIERAKDATDQFNQVIDMAKNAPFTVKELTNSWVKFRSVGIDPATGSLQSLVDAVSRFGGTDDILHRATIAVQQMAGKGVISMEELRQQMGEAVPQALVLLARGMNLSVGDMVKAISEGSVEATSALEKLFAEFRLTFGGASQKLMETYIGSLSRLTTVWQLTLNEMGQSSGLFAEVKQTLQELIVSLDDPALRRFAIDIGVGLRDAFLIAKNAITETVKFLRVFGVEVMAVIKGLAAWRIALAVLGSSALPAMAKALKFLYVELGLVTTRYGLAKLAMNGFSVATVRATFTLKGMKAAWVALKATNPVGWISLLVGALVGWMATQEDVTEVTDEGADALLRYGEASTLEQIQAAKSELANKRKALSIKEYTRALVENQNALNLDDPSVKNSLDILDADIIVARNQVEVLAARIESAISGSYERAAAAAAREMKKLFKDNLKLALNATRAEDAALNDRFRDGQINEEERLAQRQVIWQRYYKQVTAYTIKAAEEQQAIIAEANKVIANAGSEDARREWEEKKKIAVDTLRGIAMTGGEIRGEITRDLATMAREWKKISASDGADEERLKALENFLKSATGKLGGLRAQLNDGMKETERFLAMYGQKPPDGWPEAMKKVFYEALAVVQEIDETSDQLKEKKAFESAMSTAQKQLGRVTEEANMFAEAVELGLNEVPNNRVRRFRRTLEGLVATLGLSGEKLEEFNRIADQILAKAQDINVNERILGMREELEQLDLQSIQNARDRFIAEQDLLDQQFKSFLLQNAEAENIEELKVLYEQLRKKKEETFEDTRPIRKLAREWEDVMGNMEEAGAGFIDQFADKFTNALIEGKFAFKDFAAEILKELLKIMVRAMIARAIMSFMGGGSGAEVEGIDMGAFSGGATYAALGAVVGPDGEMPLKRYARGGIATRPQVAIFGEGDQNEAYVPLPDGRSIPVSMSGGGSEMPNVTVNVINESGEPVEAEQSGGQFDGENFILDVVLKAAHRPGNFRDGFRQAVK